MLSLNENSNGNHSAAPGRVLVVEDEWFLAEDYASDLRSLGLEVAGPVATVNEALDWLEKERVTLAVLDIGLAGEDSFALALELSRRSIPYVFISGYDRMVLPPELADQIILPKPIPRDSFRRTIASLMR